MAALTDLTWQQLADKLPEGAISISASSNGSDISTVLIDVGKVIDNTTIGLTTPGVIKFFSLLLSAANKAQIEANVTQEEGERLTAFSPATIGTNANGYITLTRPFTCRSELATATNIIGTNG